MFTDSITLKLLAGRGGNGIVAWRREKYLPKGGPTGGNGGKGGNVIIKGDENFYSLDAYRTHRLLKAENGQTGGPNQRQGRRGHDLIVKVPCGTLVKDKKTQTVLFDITQHGQTEVLCEGGRGGRGNASFKTSVKQAPNFSTPGLDGEEIQIELDLKVIADMGLVGFPNAGKSTLMNALTYSRAKCDAYPFTTLAPNIGFIDTPDYLRYSIADIPGIIEGAHHNRGLGLEFLKHIERTKALFFVVDISSEDPLKELQILKSEILAHDPKMLEKPCLIVLNKTDLLDGQDLELAPFSEVFPSASIHLVSALEKEGLDSLKKAIFQLMDRLYLHSA